MSNLQPNSCLEFDFQKVDQHAGGKWLIHDTKRRKDNQLQSLKLPCRIYCHFSAILVHCISTLPPDSFVPRCDTLLLVPSDLLLQVRTLVNKRLPDLWHAKSYYFQYHDVKMSATASQITSPTIVYSTLYSGADQRKHQISTSLASVGEFTGDRWIPCTKGQ